MWMRLLQPQFVCRITTRSGHSTLVCRGTLQPTPLNDCYCVRIEYRAPTPPKVWVESPALRERVAGERIPHTFRDGRPCLFKFDFRSDMVIARSVVPWLMMWLFFYEAWLVTGEWQGGGLHPGDDDGDLEDEAA